MNGNKALEYISNYTAEFALTLATAANVSVSIIKNIRVTNITYVSTRRQLGERVVSDAETVRNGRQLLAETVDTVEVSFDMVTDLGDAGYTTSAEFVQVTSANLNQAIADNTVTALIETTCGCSVSPSSITYTLAAQYPTLFPTPLPTSLPTYAPTLAMCSYDFLTCGTSLVGNNYHRGSYVGYNSGEANYVILIEAVSQNLFKLVLIFIHSSALLFFFFFNIFSIMDQPSRVVFHTCSDTTDFDTYLRLYKECPGIHPASYGHNMTVQDPDFVCSRIAYDFKVNLLFSLTRLVL